VHTALRDPENSDAGWFAFKECMAKPGIKEAWFEVKPDEIITRIFLPVRRPFFFFPPFFFLLDCSVGEKISF
jgi:hypothetical protein